MSALIEGVVAGYGIAVPVGPVAVLIIGLGARRGFTRAFFAALILGSAGGVASSVPGALLFVSGAFLASLSWQTALAAGGAVLGRRISEKTRIVTGLTGAVVILLLAVRLLLS